MDINEKKARVFDIMKESEILGMESQKLQKEINAEEAIPKKAKEDTDGNKDTL